MVDEDQAKCQLYGCRPIGWDTDLIAKLKLQVLNEITALAKINPNGARHMIGKIKAAIDKVDQEALNAIQKEDAAELERQRQEIAAGRLVPPLKPNQGEKQ